jgi:diguanylate cyclase (GGDEF)-like protein
MRDDLMRTVLKTRLLKDTLVVGLFAVVTFLLSSQLRLFERLGGLSRVHLGLQLDDLTSAAVVLAVAFAILSSRRWSALEQLTGRLAALYRTSQIVSSVLDPNEVVRQLVGATKDNLGYSHVMVLMLRDNRLVPTAWAGYTESPPDVGVDQGIAGAVLRTGRSAFVPNVASDPQPISALKSIGSAVACPIYVDGQTVGVLSVETTGTRRLGLEDVELIDSLAVQFGIALRNAMRYKQTLEQAIHDGVSGLYNHAYFHERIHEEVVRSLRYERSLTLMMLDLDDFKTINDTYGHVEGDRILRAFGALIRRAIRETDFPARYGGEEFAIVMPETSRQEAQTIAERLRRQLERSVLLKLNGAEISVTASFGLATVPEDADDPVDLITRADEALYEAKRKGKNRVASFVPPVSASVDV